MIYESLPVKLNINLLISNLISRLNGSKQKKSEFCMDICTLYERTVLQAILQIKIVCLLNTPSYNT